MITEGIFKANDIRGVTEGSEPEWDEAGAFAIGSALVDVLDLAEAGGRLVVGHDMRISGPRMSRAFADGVLSRGVDIVDIGLASTDELWFASGRLDLPGAMFTASHNPAAYNGLKFCLPGARPVTPEHLLQIADRAGRPPAQPAGAHGSLTEQDVLPDYADHLLGLVDLTGIRRLTVVVDAGNGMAGHTLPAVLGPLDLELVGLYTDPDGTFPNHQPNPLEPENLVDAQRAVRTHEADMGLVFDGDADRCFLIDERGEVVPPSTVIAMIARAELEREPGATVVCNKITSWSVPEIVGELGGEVVITRVGHTFVKAAMAEHGAVFGGEHSAHYYFREFWGADTGMLAALHVLRLLGTSDRPLSELSAGFTRYVPSGELNSRVADTDAALDRLEQAFAGRGKLDHVDGLTVAGSDWWVNVRPSNTEPLLRLNVEAKTREQMESLRDEALALIRR